MQSCERILFLLKRLNDLEGIRPPEWVRNLSCGERKLAVALVRSELPEMILAHHDRRIARGRGSIAIVRNGVCGACHLHLPTGHYENRARGQQLDVCDHCGTFLFWEQGRDVPVPILSVRTGSIVTGC